ncbi:MAG TPA: phosphotransferase [Chloroflexaceae bacterium]|nr:phosphotransferase [Chloroflexaceae bacterium]
MSLINHEFNTTFRVDVRAAVPDDRRYIAGRYLLRIHQRDHHDPRLDRQQVIESELAWLAALQAGTELAVPSPLRTTTGAAVLRAELPGVGQRFCSVLRWLGGRIEFGRATPHHLYLTGALMAQLHNHAASWHIPSDFARVRWDWHAFFGDVAPYAGLGVQQAWQALPPTYRPNFEQVVEPLRRALEALGDGPETFGLIHADLHLDNVLFAQSEARPIDFDDCGFGHWVYDMAVTLWLYRMKEDWPAYRDAFFAGYARHRRVPDDQVRYLDLFIAVRETAIALWVAATAHANPGLVVDLETELARNQQAVERLMRSAGYHANGASGLAR